MMSDSESSFEFTQNSIPDDIALNIASTLQVVDLCALGSCCQFWREVCSSDFVWACLFRDRWPAVAMDSESSNSDIIQLHHKHIIGSTVKGWRAFYIAKHREMVTKAAIVIDFVGQWLSSESVDVKHYLGAIRDMSSMEFGITDVEMLFLKDNLHVLHNFVGLHYCIAWLGAPAEYVTDALTRCKISDRQVCVKWWKLGRWYRGFRLRDESFTRRFSLMDFAISKEDEVGGVLRRGAIHEVLRVQVSAAKPISVHWSCQGPRI